MRSAISLATGVGGGKTVLHLRLLGGFEASLGGGEVLSVPNRKAQVLLAYLALARGKPVARERVMALLWSNRGEEQARTSLRQTLANLRRSLAQAAPSPLHAEREALALDPAAVGVDVVRFEALVGGRSRERLQEAMGLYGGEFLEGIVTRDPVADEWVEGERRRLGALAVDALTALVGDEAWDVRSEAFIALVQRLLELNPLQEAGHRALMRAYAARGQRALALQQYQSCAERLERELGAAPERATQALFEAIRDEAQGPAASEELPEANRPLARTDMGVSEPRAGRLHLRRSTENETGPSPTALTQWLEGLGLEDYAAAFARHDLDLEALPQLTDEDLKELGLSLGHRRKLSAAIRSLADKPRQATAARTASGAVEVPASGEGERRQLTILCCDLVNSTELAQRLDPEDLRDVMNGYRSACKSAIESYDGYVGHYVGDRVVAYFGYPQAHEDDVERAVRSGQGIVRAVRNVSSQKLSVRVGVATGPVVVGDLLGEGASQLSDVIGATPNLAVCLQGLSPPDGVVVGPTTRALVAERFELEDLGLHDLKGSLEPVRAWRVIADSQAETRFEAVRGAQLTPLVGREEEVELLLRRWARAHAGEGEVVLIYGEPGIGKSRLTQVLREQLAEERHTRLQYQCSPYHTNTALYPVIAQLERVARFGAEDGPKERLQKLEVLLRRSSVDLERDVPLFSALLSVPTNGRYRTLEHDPAQRKEETLAALLRQLEAICRRGPVLMLFEDIHWVDPSTMELVERLVERVKTLPVLLVITSRPQFEPPWMGQAHTSFMAPARLDPRDAAAMVGHVSGGKELPDEVVEQIVVKTDGVPLFVEELTKAVLESGLLKEQAERFVLEEPLPSLAIPATLKDSLMARLDRLSTAKEVAQTGAVIGREFDQKLFAAVSSLSQPALGDALLQLVESGLVLRRGTPPRATYLFKHALVQDTAYESLLRGKRQQLHARIAEVLESRFPERAEAEPELLAHHFTKAGVHEPAIEYWLRAGRRAMERSADQEAVAHLKKGLAVLQTLPESIERDRQELNLQMALSRALTTTRGWGSEEAMKAYARARELCELVGETGQLLYVLWGQRIKHWVDAEYRAALDVVAKIISLAEQQDDPMELVAANLIAGWPYLGLGELATIPSATDHALKLYDAQKHEWFRFRYGLDLRVTALGMRGYQQWLCGFPDQAISSCAEAIAWGRNLNHAGSLAWALNWAGAQPAAMRHDARTAEALANEVISLPDKGRSPMDLAWGRVFAGWAIGKRGQRKEGVSLLREGLEYLIAKGGKMLRSVHLTLLAELYIDDGELEKASQWLDEAVHHVERAEERLWEAEILRLRGEVLLVRKADHGEQPETCFKQAIDVAQRLGAKSLELRATTSLARMWRSQGKLDEAREILTPVYDWFTEGFDTADLKDAKGLLTTL